MATGSDLILEFLDFLQEGLDLGLEIGNGFRGFLIHRVKRGGQKKPDAGHSPAEGILKDPDHNRMNLNGLFPGPRGHAVIKKCIVNRGE
ncbi:MAG: hypothetical protein EBZ83_05845 [Verrucomicrobia bacterium]|nr:hypothetical protein [Verrucomicrobiota bacterium]